MARPKIKEVYIKVEVNQLKKVKNIIESIKETGAKDLPAGVRNLIWNECDAKANLETAAINIFNTQKELRGRLNDIYQITGLIEVYQNKVKEYNKAEIATTNSKRKYNAAKENNVAKNFIDMYYNAWKKNKQKEKKIAKEITEMNSQLESIIGI